MGFDDQANVTGSLLLVGAGDDPNQPPTFSQPIAGTYTSNSDGTGVITLAPQSEGDTPEQLLTVVTDGGATVLFLETVGTGHQVNYGIARLQ